MKRIDVPADATVEQLTALAQSNPESFAVHMRLGGGAAEGGRYRRRNPRAPRNAPPS
jgi:hypothetical protein